MPWGAGFVTAEGTKWTARVSSSNPLGCVHLFCLPVFGKYNPTFAGSSEIALSQQDKNIQMREGRLEADARYEAACNRLASKAVQRGSADNVTVMLVRIEH